MIKNKIFEVLDDVEPADFASEKWRTINDILDSCNEGVGFATFLRHYFSSKYKSVSKANLYDKFKELITKSKQEYSLFLLDLEAKARIYKKIVVPQRQDYNNKKEYFWLVQSLEIFNKVFNIVNIRVPIMALLDAKERNAITMKQLKDIVLYMENFHFAYTALLSKGTNRVDKHYSAFAIKLSKSLDTQRTNMAIEELKKVIEPLFPSFEDFCNKFISLSFSKADNLSNMKTKYAVSKLNSYYSESDIFDDNGSIEHILPESNELSLNIGNLILLELKINNKAKNDSYLTKKGFYEESNYKWVQRFVKEHKDWNESEVANRAKQLAQIYYENIFKRKIEA